MEKKLLLFAIGILILFLAINLVFAEDNITTTTSGGSSEQTPATNDIQTPVVTEPTTSETNPSSTSDTSDNSQDSSTRSASASEFDVKPGITPDNPIYFIKDTYQRFTVGNDPEKALDYREQKIAEAKAMIEKGKSDQANKVLDRALQYGDIVEKEVNPDLKRDVLERSEIAQNVMEDLKDKVDNQDTKEKFDENIDKEKEINNALELVSKINELCDALSKLDPLQYADTCKPKDNSPRWMKEKDKELTKEQSEQAKNFIGKLSACFENPENCDCKGMGVQKFEDFCTEKSKLAMQCKNSDEDACTKLENGADPTEVLPDYLISSFKQVESKYMKSEFDLHTPKECEKAGAKTPEACNKIIFKLNSPKECIDAGLTGESSEDEIKCKELMFQKNPPKECLEAGIDTEDKDGPRKCSKIVFAKYSAQECIDAGITGEGRDDQRKCNELTNQKSGEKNTYAPKFNKDCNKIQDATEKMKCFEEFYNNAQVQFNNDFASRELKEEPGKGKGFASKMGAANPDQPCPDGVCDQWEKEHPNDCPEDCGGSRCQSQQQIDNLKQDCINRGQTANVETRSGCPWVICGGNSFSRGSSTNYIRKDTTNQQISGGQKCPDGICDDYERMNPYACPKDCGGESTQQEPANQQPINRIDSPQQPNQQQENFCPGQAPSCAPNGAPYCQNGNWICPQPQQEEQPIQQQPIQEQQPQQPQQEQNTNPPQPPQPKQQPQQPIQEPATDSENTPVTGGVVSIDSEQQPVDNLNEFLTYWWK